MSRAEIARSIERFIRRAFRIVPDDPDFSWDSHLFESGYVDSAGVVELIAFVESTFGVKLEDEHIFSERFTTINGISSVVGLCAPKTR
ncbi:MAG: acyl carrier protein [Candidatus Rokubacteria bacterium]|nr:acyl carrier protein [Candidatus Rokubacteria bacterium]